eukprot:7150638-Prymnesium_polylepis.1
MDPSLSDGRFAPSASPDIASDTSTGASAPGASVTTYGEGAPGALPAQPIMCCCVPAARRDAMCAADPHQRRVFCRRLPAIGSLREACAGRGCEGTQIALPNPYRPYAKTCAPPH